MLGFQAAAWPNDLAANGKNAKTRASESHSLTAMGKNQGSKCTCGYSHKLESDVMTLAEPVVLGWSLV